jgi:RNA polymerase sigma factor (sigma-70 family)
MATEAGSELLLPPSLGQAVPVSGMIAAMRDDPVVVALVNRARDGDKAAWDQIVERYATLVWSVCRRHGLSGADADDVGASVWLRLVEKLATLHEPAALPGWIATTSRNECLYLLRVRKRQIPVDDESLPDMAGPASDEWLLEQEQQIALREAFEQLSERCRLLLSMLFSDPPTPYSEISARLDMPVGGIGPNRRRCLQKLREIPVIAALLNTPRSTADKG